jgi:putative ubiquitin-RnfH superfamily antitoxin RatB of RatAB toxin-antitoxin module
MKVEVAFAGPKVQKILVVDVAQGTSAYDAAVASKIDALFPEIDFETIPMGIFGKGVRKPKEEVLREGDRVELYRPLMADPKVIRARRAAKLKAQEEAEQVANE